MNDDDLSKIRGVVQGEINTALKPMADKLDSLWDQTVKITEEITIVQDTLNSHTEILKQSTNNTNRSGSSNRIKHS